LLLADEIATVGDALFTVLAARSSAVLGFWEVCACLKMNIEAFNQLSIKVLKFLQKFVHFLKPNKFPQKSCSN
jgi:hypothetical protein